MSVIAALFDKSAYNYEDAFRAKDKTSAEMKEAIRDWFELYYIKTPTKDEDPCQQIPYTVVRKLTKTVFSEYKASSKDDFAAGILASLDKCKEYAMQLGLIGGECLLKPVPLTDKSGWRWTVVRRPNVLVFARDDDGRMTDIGTAEYTTDTKSYYTLLERRTVDEKGYLTIRNTLYRSEVLGALGSPVGLSALPKYASLPDQYTFPKSVGSVGLVSMKTPVANCVDGGHDGVSVYAAAVGLIHNINQNEAQFNTEFSNGKSRVFVSADLTKRDSQGRRIFNDSIFVGVEGDPEDMGVTIFSPELRGAEFADRRQGYLRSVESVIGLKRGLLSEVEAVERTAKEVTSSEGEYNLTIIDFQNMWEDAVREAVRLCGILGQMYHVTGAHEVDEDAVAFDWGNGVLYDEDKTWADYLDMVSRGLLKPEIAIGWRFGMKTETPEDLQKVREKYMPELQAMTEGGEE